MPSNNIAKYTFTSMSNTKNDQLWSCPPLYHKLPFADCLSIAPIQFPDIFEETFQVYHNIMAKCSWCEYFIC